MKKGDVAATVSLIIVFLIALVATVVVLNIPGKGVPEGGAQAGRSAASMSGAGTEISCSTFCGSNYIGKSPDEQKKGKCGTVKCTNGKYYGFGCEYDGTNWNTQCKPACQKSLPKDSAGAIIPECTTACDSAPAALTGCDTILNPPPTITTTSPTSGDKLVLSDGTTETAQVKVGEKMTVMKKSATGLLSTLSAPIDYKLQQAGVDVLATACKVGTLPTTANCVKCGSTPADCTSANYNPFIVPAAGMPDGAYTLLITEPDPLDPTKPPIASGAWTFSWTCPAVTIESKPYNAGKTMTAVFESKIDAVSDVTIKLNGGTVTKYPPSATSPNKISFDIPKLGAGGSTLIEGNNELVVKREGKGLCLKAGKIENGIAETFNWACPAKGCYQKAGKWFVVSGKGITSSTCASPGSCQDISTGCWYDKIDGAECKHGCADGACKSMDLRIDSIKLDTLEIYNSEVPATNPYIYGAASLAEGKEVTVGIENKGGVDADNLVVAIKFGGGDLNYVSAGGDVKESGSKLTLAAGKRGTITYLLPADGTGTSMIPGYLPVIKGFTGKIIYDAPFEVSIDNPGETDQTPADNKYTLSNIYHSCCDPTGGNCAAPSSECIFSAASCNACPLCKYDTTSSSCKPK